ncbi:MAG: diadenylate cyclase [Desulfobacterales bacterium]|jgi:DNA integrity scanning protein DisA with diadenylate cyclase activity
MDLRNDENILSEEERLKEKLEDLRCRLGNLCQILPSLKQCARLSNLLQEVFKLREGLNLLEQGLLQTHLKCCISPDIKVPGEVALAVSKLSSERHGAIIVIEQKNNLDDYLRGGVMIDAVVSAPILESIFFPGSQLHDGAALIRKARIQRAGCFIRIAQSPSGLEALNLGTRHRAAVGLSQASDALIIVVSEEKGWISLALGGQLYPNVGTFALLKSLGNGIAG